MCQEEFRIRSFGMVDGSRRLAAEIVSSYVEHNAIAADDLVALITSTIGALESAMAPATPGLKPVQKPTGAQIKKSISPDALLSFIDGQSNRMLKRHLASNGMTPEEYRVRLDLPRDYPMSAPSYSEKRSALARSFGLGKRPTPSEPIVGNPSPAEKAGPGTRLPKAVRP